MTPVRTIPAVVTAGGRLTGELASAAQTTIKALAPVGDKPLLAFMLDALQAAPNVGPIVVVGPQAELAPLCETYNVRLVAEGTTGPENVLRGLEAVQTETGDGCALVCTSDLPFVSADALVALLSQAPSDADIVFPVIERADYDAQFAGSPNVWTPLDGKEYTGGSVLLVRPDALKRNRALIERVFAARKSQWNMARLLGLRFALRFKRGKLSIAQAEKRASEITGCRCVALVGADPRLSADIDNLADYLWAQGLPLTPPVKPQNESGPGANLPPPLREMAREAQERAREAQGRAREAGESLQGNLRDAQTNWREAGETLQASIQAAQERALDLARLRAQEAQDAARRASEAMPPGLLVRLTSSMLGIPLLLLLVFAEGVPNYPALPFAGAVAVCATLGGWEYFRGLRLRGFRPSEGGAFIAIALLQFAAWGVSRGLLTSFLPALIAILVIATLIHQILKRDPEPLANIGVTFLGVVYVGWLFSYLIFLRSLPGVVDVWPFTHTNFNQMFESRGAWIVLYVFAVTWSTDAGAYFFGMKFGKTPLAPNLSPKKTREGAIGGLVAATVMSLAWGLWIGLPWFHCLFLGPVLGALGQIGDLCESALKRDLGIKDFGTLLPGHGGILDRFDSLLFTAPIAYYYLIFVLPRVF